VDAHLEDGFEQQDDHDEADQENDADGATEKFEHTARIAVRRASGL
jgi:hypothetical protein